jgi:copper oxidase (laccase) domain-containing protein
MNQMHGARVLDAAKSSRVGSADAAKFFSFRGGGNTGRMATLIWLESEANT